MLCDNHSIISIAKFIYNLSDKSRIFEEIASGYSKQVAFRDYTYNEVVSDSEKAISWFNDQKKYWGNYFKNIMKGT